MKQIKRIQYQKDEGKKITLKRYLADYAKMRRVKSTGNLFKKKEPQVQTPQDIFKDKINQLLKFIQMKTNDQQVLNITQRLTTELIDLFETTLLNNKKGEDKQTNIFSNQENKSSTNNKLVISINQVPLVDSLANQRFSKFIASKDNKDLKMQFKHKQKDIQNSTPIVIKNEVKVPIFQMSFDNQYQDQISLDSNKNKQRQKQVIRQTKKRKQKIVQKSLNIPRLNKLQSLSAVVDM